MSIKRVAIDLTQVPVNKTGVGVYVRHLLDEFGRQQTSPGASQTLFEFTAFIVSDDQELISLARRRGIKVRLIPRFIGRKILFRILFEQAALPFLCFVNRIHLLHSIHYTMPIVALCRRVVTIHDLSIYLYPEYLPRLRRIVFQFFLFFTLRFSSALVCVSHSTRADLLARFPFLEKRRVHTVQLGFAELDGMADKPLPDNIQQPYILFVGTIEPRKNIDGLIDAFSQAAHDLAGAHLVIAGGRGWMYEQVDEQYRRSKVRERIHFVGYVSEEQKQSLMAKARLLVYPSFYEGFGLPVLEGMAAGVPVITSNLSAMPEVAGDGALQVDPHSPKALADAITFLWNDRTAARSLAQRGRERAAEFSWAKTAQATLQCYEDALA